MRHGDVWVDADEMSLWHGGRYGFAHYCPVTSLMKQSTKVLADDDIVVHDQDAN
jgi:hypothetical protein